MSYREHFNIIADILNAVDHNPKKTKIMYQANLSYGVLQRYLAETVAASLIDFEAHSQSYLLTLKGREFLYAYKEYSKIRHQVERSLYMEAAKRKVLEQLCCSSQTDI